MSKGKGRKKGKRPGSALPTLVDPRFAKALSHVLRQHILLATIYGEASAKMLAKRLDEELNQVHYHFKVLRDLGIIVETKTEPRRGALEHYYRANLKVLLPAKEWLGLDEGLRAIVGAGQANDLFRDLAEAVKTGKLNGEQDLISRTPLILDAEGKDNVKGIMELAYREMEDEQYEAAKRMAKANGDGGEASAYNVALLGFDAAWEPTDLHSRQTTPNRSPKSRGKAKGTRKTRGKRK